MALAWAEAHCVIPDGFRKGQPIELYDWQYRALGRHYLVKPDAPWVPENPVKGPAFVYRRTGIVGPQKLGKDPKEAVHICIEGDGPALFAGWAGPDAGWACSDRGCPCGWEYPYAVGEAMGMRWPTALIQVTAVSEDATSNTFSALKPMIEDGPLSYRIRKTTEEFIRLPGGGRIDVVTASGKSRLGERVTHVSWGQAEQYTRSNGMLGPMGVAEVQSRGLAGMGGRGSWQANAWDPSEASWAQREFEAAAPDVHIQFDRPPSGLSFTVKDERRRILRAVYPPDVLRENGGHVDLDSIEAEAVGIIAHDPPQAARFFGNQIVTGGGKAFDRLAWDRLVKPDHTVPDKAQVALGFDGSKTGDWTALAAVELATGYVWPLGVWKPEVVLSEGAPPEVDRDAVDLAVDDAFHRYRVVRFYADPPYWKEEVAAWAGRYGDKVVIKWETYVNRRMGMALRSFAQAITDKSLSHDGNDDLAAHIGNAAKLTLKERDDKGTPFWKIQKETPDSPKKIDAAMAAILAWEARTDAIAAGALKTGGPSIYETRDPVSIGYDDEEDGWPSERELLRSSGLLVT